MSDYTILEAAGDVQAHSGDLLVHWQPIYRYICRGKYARGFVLVFQFDDNSIFGVVVVLPIPLQSPRWNVLRKAVIRMA